MASPSPRERCTCIMGGSFIYDCPTHGERETLIYDATAKLRTMTTKQLRAFLAVGRV